ncbi:hypothetical protein O6H91_19G053400 [Diphasiastrum complanatum]|uniref:Uncharacterized protein n=1 Tax=Diphasiastrum complanatum TaxID=34168 RepID=A0ACC2AV81_DIPCM|nr:hypothetical protein O6H91_19G053400 [Diphasiastrum complanatum]
MASAQKKMVKSKSRRQMAEPQKNPLEVELLANLKRETARAGNGLTCVSLPEKQQFCQKLLADGRPKAFVELFQLTHTVDSEVIPAEVGNDARSVSQQRNLSNKEMLRTLSNHLIDAELAVRAGDAELLFVAYLEVAKLFDYSGDFEKAIAYYFKCFAAAEKTCNIFHECQVMFNLGKVYWKLQDSLKAINSFEDCLALARTNNNHGRAMLAAENLLEIYWKCAEQSKQVGDHLKSIEYFEKVCKLASMQRH